MFSTNYVFNLSINSFISGSVYPEWSLQKPFGSHASGSPQSQQPLVKSLIIILCPLWLLFWKHSWQIIQVSSSSQSIHLYETSLPLKTLPQTTGFCFSYSFIKINLFFESFLFILKIWIVIQSFIFFLLYFITFWLRN